MAIRYLVTEEGDRILLEDGSALLVLEDSSAPPEIEAIGVVDDLLMRKAVQVQLRTASTQRVKLAILRHPQVIRVVTSIKNLARPLAGVISVD